MQLSPILKVVIPFLLHLFKYLSLKELLNLFFITLIKNYNFVSIIILSTKLLNKNLNIQHFFENNKRNCFKFQASYLFQKTHGLQKELSFCLLKLTIQLHLLIKQEFFSYPFHHLHVTQICSVFKHSKSEQHQITDRRNFI